MQFHFADSTYGFNQQRPQLHVVKFGSSTQPCITERQPQEVSHETAGKSETDVKVTQLCGTVRLAPGFYQTISLGKMMCRRTYTQIARAAWRNGKIREQLISFS